MSFDPTQQVPPPQSYPSQQPYQQPPTYPPPQPVAPTPYTQYSSQPVAAPGGGFDFNVFWRSLGLTGQVAGIAGLAVFIFFLLPWFSASSNSSSESYNGFSTASGSFSGVSINLFPYLWLVLLGAVGLLALAWLISRRRLSSGTAAAAVIATAGVMLALEICFLTEVNSFVEFFSRSNSGGASVGFWLAALATVAALGAAIYGVMQQRKGAGPYQQLPAPPYGSPSQQPGQYPGQYPGQPPYAGQ